MLDGRFLDTGLGLGALRLFLLCNPTSPETDVLPTPGAKLDGREGFLTGAARGGGAWERTVTIMGLTNMP